MVLKQFIQFCLILIYPAWVFAVLVGVAVNALFYVTVYPVLWLLFWPVRALPEEEPPGGVRREPREVREQEVAET